MKEVRQFLNSLKWVCTLLNHALYAVQKANAVFQDIARVFRWPFVDTGSSCPLMPTHEHTQLIYQEISAGSKDSIDLAIVCSM